MGVTQDHERIEAIGDQLRARITSKFTASTFLAGFALTIVSGQVFSLWQSTILPVLPLAVGTVAAAVVLFVVAVLRLDALTMPKRFWDESDTAGDTGHSSRDGHLLNVDLWELRKHMMFYWTRFTLLAAWITGIAALTMLVPFKPLPVECIRSTIAWALLGPAVAGLYGVIVITLARNAKDETKRLRPLIRQPD